MVLGGLVAVFAAVTGCSSDNPSATTTAGTGGAGGAGGSGGAGTGGAGGTSGGTCTSGIQIIFNPVYSAYDGTNTYKVPVIAYGITDSVKWSASDSSMVDLDPDAVQFGDAGPSGRGVMITTRKAGKVTISAVAGSACGSTELTITQATPELRQIGSDRYNNGVPVTFDGGMTPSCTNCHGATAPNTMLIDVQHTPQQTGGYSDEDLINIFTKGQKPPNGGCRVINPCGVWTSFHKWSATDQETQGIVFYLRSLEPTPQGSITFGGGRPPPDAGGAD
jgi:hypothetical protein